MMRSGKRQSYQSYVVSGVLICLLGLLSTFMLHALLVKISTEKFVTSLMQDYRRDLVSGSRTVALQKLKNKVGSDFGFVEIAYTIPGNRIKFLNDAYVDRGRLPFSEKIITGSVDSILYYDSEGRDLAISFIFYYRRFSGFLISFVSWTIFCAAIAVILRRFYSVNKKSEDIRNAAERSLTIASMVQAISHDMRAPLGIFERLLLLDSRSTIGVHKYSIRESLNRLQSMIESLRHSEAEILIRRQMTRIDFDHGFESLSHAAAKRGVHLQSPPRSLPFVLLDGAKFERAWLNLLSNAISAAKHEVRLEIETVGSDLKLRVYDDGPGVPAEFLPKLFQRGATHGKDDGTGLGLAYVRQIMRGHGGDIAYWRENNMTVFECHLPNAVFEAKEKETNSQVIMQEKPLIQDPDEHGIIHVSLCFRADLSRKLFDRLSGISQNTHSFVEGFDSKSVIVLTNSEEISDRAVVEGKRLIMFDQFSGDDEILRGASFRLGIRG